MRVEEFTSHRTPSESVIWADSQFDDRAFHSFEHRRRKRRKRRLFMNHLDIALASQRGVDPAGNSEALRIVAAVTTRIQAIVGEWIGFERPHTSIRPSAVPLLDVDEPPLELPVLVRLLLQASSYHLPVLYQDISHIRKMRSYGGDACVVWPMTQCSEPS